MSTPAQRLAWQWEDQTAGLYADPSPEELDEIRDDEFRHWETFIFARAAGRPLGVLGARTGAPLVDEDSDSSSGAPHLYPAGDMESRAQSPAPTRAGGEVTGIASPPGAGGLAFNFEHLMWSA